MGYAAIGHGFIVLATDLQRGFGAVYSGITQRIIPRAAKSAGEMQTGVLGINGMLMLATLVILLVLVAIWGV